MSNSLKLASKLILLNGNPITLPTAASDPGSAVAGDTYYNTSSNAIRYYNGSLWSNIGSGGSVTSVSLSDSSTTPIYSVSGSPVTTSGTLSISLNTQTANTVFAGPSSGSAAQPSFRALVATDIPTLNQNTTGTASNITATSNSTLTTLSALSLPGSQVTGNISGNAANITATSNSTLTTLSALSLPQTQVTGLSTTYLALAGGTMTGAINLGGYAPTNSTTPVNANDLVNKSYVDNFINATSWKTAALVATTANITLSGEQTIDGVLTSSSRVLVKNQNTASQNGIYTTGTGAWTRTSDMNAWSQVPAAAVFIEEGTVNADLGFVCTSQPGGTIGTTAINFVQFSSAGSYSADNTTLQLISGVFSIKNGGVGVTQLGSITDGVTLDQSGSGSTLEIKAGGVSNTQISSSAAIAFSKLAALTSGNILVGNASNVAASVAVSGDITLSNSGVSAVAKIAGVSVGTPTGTGNVVFSASPTFTGTISAAAANFSSALGANGGITSSGTLLLNANGGASPVNLEASSFGRSTDGTNFVVQTYVDSTTLTDNTTASVAAFQFPYATYAGEEITYVIESGNSAADCRIGSMRITTNNSGTISASLSDFYTESADCGVQWSAAISGSNVVVSYTTTSQGASRTMRADLKLLRR